MTTAVDLRIDIAALVDKQGERWDNDFDSGINYPTLRSFDTEGGETWLTDRFWLLPESVCDIGEDQFEVLPLPGDELIAKARGWVQSILTAPITEGPAHFAPTFAGVLTLAGLTAYAIEGERVYALVKGLDRIGGIMPMSERQAGKTVPIPVSNAVVAMYRKIISAHVVEPWQAWDLAAHLTSA